MRKITGTLIRHGNGYHNMGGIQYDDLEIRQDDGKKIKIRDITALQNVDDAIVEIMERDASERRVTLYMKGNFLIYALEEENGTVHSDVSTIKSAWYLSLLKAFGPMILGIFLFLSGDSTLGIGGFILMLIGIIAIILHWRGTILFWPAMGTGALHRRSLHPPAANSSLNRAA